MMEDESGGRYERRPEGFGKKFCFCFVCVLRNSEFVVHQDCCVLCGSGGRGCEIPLLHRQTGFSGTDVLIEHESINNLGLEYRLGLFDKLLFTGLPVS